MSTDDKVNVKMEPNAENDDKPNILKRKILSPNNTGPKKFIPRKVKEEYLPPVCCH